MKQKEFFGWGALSHLSEILESLQPKKIFLVTKTSYNKSGASVTIDPLLKKYDVTYFDCFSSNPKIEEVEEGLKKFKNNTDLVIAVGGGSTIDTAKLINIMAANEGGTISALPSEIKKEGKPFIVIPTTAGSGSEATKYVVVYYKKKKYSVAHDFLLPTYSIIDPKLTSSMPKKTVAASGMDALSQAIEAYWSVNSTTESKLLSKQAIELILDNFNEAVNNPSKEARVAMMKAANLAGKAINIAKTTASHALAYSITSHFGVLHGHAVGLTLGSMLEFNYNIIQKDCADDRGVQYVQKTIMELCDILGVKGIAEAKEKIRKLMVEIGLETKPSELGIGDEEFKIIRNNINLERLKNNPRKIFDDVNIKSFFMV